MDEKADSGHNQKHDQRKLIKIKSEIRAEIAGTNPLRHSFNMRKFKRREARGHEESQSKRCAGKGQRGRGDGLPCEPLPEETVQRRTNQRQDWDQPEVEVRRHSLSRFT